MSMAKREPFRNNKQHSEPQVISTKWSCTDFSFTILGYNNSQPASNEANKQADFWLSNVLGSQESRYMLRRVQTGIRKISRQTIFTWKLYKNESPIRF